MVSDRRYEFQDGLRECGRNLIHAESTFPRFGIRFPVLFGSISTVWNIFKDRLDRRYFRPEGDDQIKAAILGGWEGLFNSFTGGVSNCG